MVLCCVGWRPQRLLMERECVRDMHNIHECIELGIAVKGGLGVMGLVRGW
jgi:hypothetical protein